MTTWKRTMLVLALVALASGLGHGYPCGNQEIAFAAESAVAAPAPAAVAFSFASLWQLLIPVAVPLLIAFLKFALQVLPGWLLPILAPVLGGLADAAIAYATGGTANPMLGMILGSAGVGIREVVDQLKKAGS